MTALPDDIEARLRAAAPGGIGYSRDETAKGVAIAWCELADPADLEAAARCLKDLGARLSTITALQPKPPEADDDEEEEEDGDDAGEAGEPEPPRALGGVAIDGTSYEIAYHFDVDGDTLTLMVFLPAGGADVPSLTPLFRNADWSERELMEIYSIRVAGHPDPRRLFLDESVDAAVLERLIPFSTLVNAASTKSLWEKILEQKGGAS
ncbi:Carbon monoxide-induced hydrogenase NuoC-like protein CooU [uncultured Alphaproteobacteria bacterium]|uniref:Carbon monoxide-induced hydrogenase NuoC-like protein CooU n=1 Tax=uncultured Alphaproteobacteria bacterium TaxID=91750 RepID=A0A212K3Y0_9PROT|nr:Carbon monoxide-induced hydrogenase NuoC-like protein CooU [uncultured Alphaproteobacteria bacterium]